MKEAAVLTAQAVARAALRAGTAVSCSSRTGLQGFSPVLSSTLCRSSFLEGITHTGLAALQGIPAQLCCMSRAVAVAGEVRSSWTHCCVSFPWALSSLMHESVGFGHSGMLRKPT